MNRRTALLLIGASGLALIGPGDAAADGAHDFTFTSLEGEAMPLSQWRGKVLLVVNTASFCGFTPQYEDLVQVWQDYAGKGLVVIGVPSNDFRQESGDAAAIKSFCELTYGVDFPMSDKVSVKGPAAHPFYKWAAAASGREVAWNFNKYLIGRDGEMIAWMPSTMKPTSSRARTAIEAALAAPPA